VPAATAQQWGLVTKVVPRDALLNEARAIAAKIASHPSDGAIQNTREGLRRSIRATLDGQKDITIFSNQLLASLFDKMGARQPTSTR
jgi:2-(1,2-epoxy-1,2-dihydrophenyl)acetyl-CoA isomerase